MSYRPHSQTRQRGASLIQVVIALVVIFGFVALSVDYGAMAVRQRKLQSATDAGALAAGPLLATVTNGTSTASGSAQVMAETFALKTSAVAGSVSAAGNSSEHTLTVTAWDGVSTPFLNVLKGQTDRTVSAVSKVKAEPNLDPAWLAPLAIQHSYLKEDMTGLWGKPAELLMLMQYQGNEWDFVSDPGTPWTGNEAVLQANCVSIDLKNTSRSGTAGYDQAVEDYIDFMNNGLSGEVVYFQKNNEKLISVSSLRFQNPTAWQNATFEAFQNILERASTDYSEDDWSHFDGDNPRFVVLMLINRTTGTSKKEFDCDFVGYVGFFIENVYYSTVAQSPAISGRFVQYSGPRPATVGGYPPTEVLPGLFTYSLVD